MKRSIRFARVLWVLSLLALGLAGQANAADLFWDSVISAGSWIDDGTTLNWGTVSGGGGTYDQSAWVGGSDARFEGTSGIVTVSGTILSVNAISFDASGYTLSGGTIKLTGAGGNITTGASPDTATINSVIDGSVGLTKNGTGTLTLGGANIYTGLTTVSAGTLAYGVANAIPAGNDVTVDGATAILDIAGFNGSVGTVILDNGGGITGAAGVLTSSATFDVRDGSISAILNGANGLTKSTGGTVTLSRANTYTGTTSINLGTLKLAGTGTLGTSGNNLTLAGGSLDLGGLSQTVGAVDIQATGAISNGGTLSATSMTKSGTGTGQLGAVTAVSGATTVAGGTLQYSANGTTGSIVINGGDITIDDGVTLNSTTGNFTFSSKN